ncbi:hypothetical protein [Arachidicoccus sp.]|uniref:hypothetical protein n=1 Tax=Arachidicoccus sp. TaxID=1872624 RepID=UPI003D217D3E
MNFITDSKGKVPNLVVVDYDRISWDDSEVRKEIKNLKHNYNAEVLVTQKVRSVKKMVDIVKPEQQKSAHKKWD